MIRLMRVERYAGVASSIISAASQAAYSPKISRVAEISLTQIQVTIHATNPQ